jgi:hypothetical protein
VLSYQPALGAREEKAFFFSLRQQHKLLDRERDKEQGSLPITPPAKIYEASQANNRAVDQLPRTHHDPRQRRMSRQNDPKVPSRKAEGLHTV